MSASISPYEYPPLTTFAFFADFKYFYNTFDSSGKFKKSSILPHHLSPNIIQKHHSSIENPSSPSSGSLLQTLLSQVKKLLARKVTPSSLNPHQSPTNQNSDWECALFSLGEDEDHSLSHSINPPLVEEQKALIAQVHDFEEGVRTRMKQKYSQNHKVVIFQPEDIVTLRIRKES